MNDKLKKLVRRVIITATAAITGAPAVVTGRQALATSSSEAPVAKIAADNSKKGSNHTKLVLERPSKANLGSYLLAVAHVSHSSHASHASHASHVSGYTEPRPTPAPQPNQNPAESGQKQSDDQTLYKLGSRTLKRGMAGTDVAELQQKLIEKGYRLKITAKYDSITEEAVKKFQRAKQVDVTGEVDALTLFYLLQK